MQTTENLLSRLYTQYIHYAYNTMLLSRYIYKCSAYCILFYISIGNILYDCIECDLHIHAYLSYYHIGITNTQKKYEF